MLCGFPVFAMHCSVCEHDSNLLFGGPKMGLKFEAASELEPIAVGNTAHSFGRYANVCAGVCNSLSRNGQAQSAIRAAEFRNATLACNRFQIAIHNATFCI